MVDAVVVRQRLHETIAEARFAHPDGALVSLAAGNAHDGHGDQLGGAGADGGVASTKGQP